ncbi:MAG: FGGY family carbohydrate kinase, partial [Bacillota bacterium]
MRYLLGVDFGGSSSKATLLGENGMVAAASSREYPTYYPHNGWAEQDPEDSYTALVENIRELLEKTNIKPEDVAALALDAATHTAVLLDDTDKPVRRAIYWTDSRAAKQAAQLKTEMGEAIMRECYNSVSSLWTLPQLMWLKENEPQALQKVKKVLAVKDYVRYRLTGDYVTDYIEAMGFLLLDVKRNQWSVPLCELADLNPDIMPPLVDPMQRLSPLTKQAQADTGLTASTVVIAGATDTVMEVYAAGAVHVGQATVKLATAGRICSVTDHEVVDPRLVTYRHVVKGLWYPGTATKSCAASNRWYRDTFGGDFGEMDLKSAIVARGCEGLFFHPYLQGEITPYLDDKLRASFTGAAGFHTKAHFNRAVLEGVAFGLRDSFELIKSA